MRRACICARPTRCVALKGQGAAAYLDMDKVIAAAKAAGCDAVHPGYGFLAERGDFAAACAEAGLTFVGPQVKHLELFGDKARARQAAVAAKVPVIRGIDRACTLEDAKAFFASLGPDGGDDHQGAGRRRRARHARGDGGGRDRDRRLRAARRRRRPRSAATNSMWRNWSPARGTSRCRSSATAKATSPISASANAACSGASRSCWRSRRRRRWTTGCGEQIIAAAVRLANSVGYFNLGTFEFLVDVSGRKGAQPFAFIEANARLQVEHTVTEAVTGVDLVQSQIRLAQGATLKELGLDRDGVATPRGYAIQARVNMETINADGAVRPGGGTLTVYEAPNGPGVRTDGFGYAGYKTSSAFNSLLAKVIAHSPAPDFATAVSRLTRALSEFRLEGVSTNIAFLRNILAHPDFVAAKVHTRWLDEHTKTLAATGEQRQRFVQAAAGARSAHGGPCGRHVKS